MKTNKLPQSVATDGREAGSQFQQPHITNAYNDSSQSEQTSFASNDANYSDNATQHKTQNSLKEVSSQEMLFGYKSTDNTDNHVDKSIEVTSAMSDSIDSATTINKKEQTDTAADYQPARVLTNDEPLMSSLSDETKIHSDKMTSNNHNSYKEIPERIFMNGLIKHTGIALAIIIPLAAFSAYAATPPVNMATNNTATNRVSDDAMSEKTTTDMLSVKPSDIIHESASTPTTVDSVDLNTYEGTWYEIGRLPMYFQRKCAGDVTANYAQKDDGSGITVTNKCVAEDGSEIVAEGLAKPADESGSKLKVTFLPKWIRWIPVGRADYWVLARDAEYKTALVGTPDKKYLWLLARSPNISQETYTKYRQIAQQQGYDLKEFTLTSQSNQTVNLAP